MIGALIARIAPWSLVALAVAGVVIWGLWGRLEAAETKLANAQAIIEQREKDAKANAIAVAQLADTLSKTEAKVITVTEKIYALPVTRSCAQSQPMKTASEEIKHLFAPVEKGK